MKKTMWRICLLLSTQLDDNKKGIIMAKAANGEYVRLGWIEKLFAKKIAI